MTYAASQPARVFEVGRDSRTLYGCMRSTGPVTEFESCGPLPEPTCGGSTRTWRSAARLYWTRDGLPQSAPLQ